MKRFNKACQMSALNCKALKLMMEKLKYRPSRYAVVLNSALTYQAESLEAKVSEAVQTYVQSLNYCLGDKPIYTANDSSDHYGLVAAFVKNIKGDSTLHSHIFNELRGASNAADTAVSAIKTYTSARAIQTLAKSSGVSVQLAEQINKHVEDVEATADFAMHKAKSTGTVGSFLMCAGLESKWLVGASSSMGDNLRPLPVKPVDRRRAKQVDFVYEL